MNIVIASTIVPFINGGGTFIVDWTATRLKKLGHNVEVLKIPFSHCYPTAIKQMIALESLDLPKKTDLLISIRTPSYLINHPNHVCWFIHHYRVIYELWGTKLQEGVPNTANGLRYRQAIIDKDNEAFKKIKKIYTNSVEVKERLEKYNNYEAEVLYPPLMDQEDFYCKEYGDFIYYASRLTTIKRQYLAIEAMRFVKSKVKLIISGFPDTPEAGLNLKELIKKHNLSDRVTLIDKWITKNEKIDFFSRCLASIYIPYKEDSYGYPALESFASSKAVITCEDSGGTGEIIKDKENGLIVKPNPKSLAKAFDQLYKNKEWARAMGLQANKTLLVSGINWENVLIKLTK